MNGELYDTLGTRQLVSAWVLCAGLFVGLMVLGAEGHLDHLSQAGFVADRPLTQEPR